VTSRLTSESAAELAERLELDVHDIPICLACLSFVSMAIRCGDEADVRREVSQMTPELWAEGLDQPLRLALRRAVELGVAFAREGLADVDARHGRSAIAKAVVRRLGQQLDDHAQGDFLKMGFEPWPPRGGAMLA
jgi:hypothetical protein